MPDSASAVASVPGTSTILLLEPGLGLLGPESSGFDRVREKEMIQKAGFELKGDGKYAINGEGIVINATLIKYGVFSQLSHIWKVDTHGKMPKFEHILTSTMAKEALRGGFVVKKLERKKLEGNMELELEENEEIEIKMGHGLKLVEFTNENPWLKLLPHLRLDLDKMSLYSEIRSQPKVGCLSTIESIVYSLKGLGEKVDGLENLLDVFESMVGDQRAMQKLLSHPLSNPPKHSFSCFFSHSVSKTTYDPPFSPTSKPPKPKPKPPDPTPNRNPTPIKSSLPFNFRHSYSETDPSLEPIGFREPKRFSPFGPGRLDREWTGTSAPV
ncbi:hypothetical protein PVK06_018193 [Gossypium arboreum]|uniref:tRNA-uridine aminocarboxypropyltransferase n=1 Tax=Gossypium arboreum TaxID=29729 RepID=A0ABR0Q573_GOSAR|nr:hypothetical protein PVK06_018193 [Gossypium arboreum]